MYKRHVTILTFCSGSSCCGCRERMGNSYTYILEDFYTELYRVSGESLAHRTLSIPALRSHQTFLSFKRSQFIFNLKKKLKNLCVPGYQHQCPGHILLLSSNSLTDPLTRTHPRSHSSHTHFKFFFQSIHNNSFKNSK